MHFCRFAHILLPPANEVCEGYVFTRVCQSFCSRGGSASVHAGIPPPTADPPGTHPQHTPSSGTPPSGTPPTHTPPLAPPQCRACWEIRSMRGRYASYWNAILLFLKSIFATVNQYKASVLSIKYKVHICKC